MERRLPAASTVWTSTSIDRNVQSTAVHQSSFCQPRSTAAKCNGATSNELGNRTKVGPSLLPSPLCGTCVTALSPNQICLSQKESSRHGGADSASSCYAKVFEQKKKMCLPCFPCHITFQLRTSDGFDGLPARFFFTLFWANRVCVGQHLGIQHEEKPRHFDSTLIQDCL